MAAQKYTVKKGDSLWGIAQDLCGNGEYWKIIYYDNICVVGDDPDFILSGQVLDVDCPPSPCLVYVVKYGDTLTGIAKKICGNADWQTIYNNNMDVIGDDPDLIFPGQVFCIRC